MSPNEIAAIGNTLKSRLDQWVTWFLPKGTAQAGRQHSANRLLVYICLITSAFSLLYLATSLAIGFAIGAVLMLVCFALFWPILFHFRARGSFRWSANLYLANCFFVAILGCSFFTGGLRSPVLPWFTLVPVATVLLLGLGADAWRWFLLCCAVTLAYGLAGMQGFQFPELYRLEFSNVFSTLCTTGLVMILFFIALTFDHNRNLVVEKILEQNGALKLARRQAEAASRAKSDFLANMSHEIRTPMNGVIGMVDILQETQLAPDQRRMLDTIHGSSLALLHILNDILDYSKMEAGKLAMERLPIHLRDAVESAAQLMSTSSAAKAVELSVFVSPELPMWVYSDPTRLRQVLLNLLGNAIKFTGDGSGRVGRVALRVQPCSLADGNSGMELQVIDNGIGISEHEMGKLFQPFSQADEGTARKFGGVGLGLSITWRLVELLQGQIRVQSTPGAGSVFTVVLPLLVAPAARLLPDEPRLDGVHVVGVTHDAEGGEFFRAYCVAAGARATVVTDLVAAREALQKSLQAGAPTVLALGLAVTEPASALGLPSGIGVIRFARRSDHTAFGNEVTVPARPMCYADLVRAVALVAGRLRAPDGLDPPWHREQRSSRRASPPGAQQAAASQQLILLAEDNETNREVVQEQLRLLGYAVEVAADGAVALQMWRDGLTADNAGPTGRYALLLTDCHMPQLDGFGLTAAIRRAEPEGTRLPIIAVTANAMQGEAERCSQRGMDDYLSKPLRLNELARMLAKWLVRLTPPQGSTQAAPLPLGEGLAESSAEAAIWDANALTALVGNNPALHQRLIGKFLLNAQTQVLAIQAAALAGDLHTLAGVAHTLKSAARSVGAMALGALCQSLETAGRANDGLACNQLAPRVEVALRVAIQIKSAPVTPTFKSPNAFLAPDGTEGCG
ncbi:MAG: hypothetical protein A3F78_06140 [Burkholderiales bacterium RIFCSPLOWO2_12_FULL_61_40]|nr:MAG: hypothetical protein A3F78_06140 [Burkholderiales bacterium RIFCSPLOWO2_12_FULL_61_40]